MKTIFKNACVNGKLTDFTVEDGKFVSFEKTAEPGLDLGGKRVLPGLMDVHIHGGVGCDVMDGGDAMPTISAFLAKNGVTSFLPTTMTMGMDTIREALAVDPAEAKGAKALGYHLEGPYIAMSRRGAQNPAFIRKPDLKEFETLPNVRMVTIAPEEDEELAFTKNCKAVVSVGHTDATFEQTAAALDAGAVCLTHTFNAMPPLLHRAPGPIGAAIEKNAYVQLICDGFHVMKSTVLMLYRTFGRERVVLISDAIRATGFPDGHYEFGGQEIVVAGGHATLLDGTVAGSTSTLLNDVKTAISFGIPEEDALYMASRTPAKLMGENKGLLEPGFDADFIVTDEDLNIFATFVGGNKVYEV